MGRRVAIGDGSMSRELRGILDRISNNKAWTGHRSPETGYFLAAPTGATRAHWQLAPPPLVRDLFLNKKGSPDFYWDLLASEKPEPLDAAVVVILLSAGRAALGILRGDFCATGVHQNRRKPALL